MTGDQRDDAPACTCGHRASTHGHDGVCNWGVCQCFLYRPAVARPDQGADDEACTCGPITRARGRHIEGCPACQDQGADDGDDWARRIVASIPRPTPAEEDAAARDYAEAALAEAHAALVEVRDWDAAAAARHGHIGVREYAAQFLDAHGFAPAADRARELAELRDGLVDGVQRAQLVEAVAAHLRSLGPVVRTAEEFAAVALRTPALAAHLAQAAADRAAVFATRPCRCGYVDWPHP